MRFAELRVWIYVGGVSRSPAFASLAGKSIEMLVYRRDDVGWVVSDVISEWIPAEKRMKSSAFDGERGLSITF